VNELMSLAILSPTAFNIQHWRFVIAENKELRKKIREVSWNQPQVTDASLLVILCADLKAWQKNPERYYKNTKKETQEKLISAIHSYYHDNEQIQRDEAIRSCGLVATTLMLAAKNMGYDTCPMDGFDFNTVGELINLPEDHVIVMFIAIGKKLAEAQPRMGQLPLSDVIIKNNF